MKLYSCAILAFNLLVVAIAQASPTVTFEAYSAGENVRIESRVYIYKPGEHDKHLFMRLVGVPVAIPEGTYDFEARLKTSAGTHSHWREGISIKSDQTLKFDYQVELGRIRMDFTNNGKNVNHHTRWSVFKEGRNDKRLARALGGGELLLDAGVYDIHAIYKEGNLKREKWLRKMKVVGKTKESFEFSETTAGLIIRVREKGEPLKTAACKILTLAPDKAPDGTDRFTLAAATLSDQQVVLKPGTYHVLCTYGETGASSRAFVKDVKVEKLEELVVDMNVARQPLNELELASKDQPSGEGGVELIAPENEKLPKGEEQKPEDKDNNVDPYALENPGQLTLFDVDHEDSKHVRMKIRMKIKGGSQSAPSKEAEDSNLKKKNIQVILDASGSMWGQINGEPKISIAKKVLRDLYSELEGESVKVAFRVYGTAPKKDKNCQDSKLLIPFSKFDSSTFDQALSQLKPSGYTPIAYTLAQAKADFPANETNSIVLITDGIESCDGDPCQIAASLSQEGILSKSFVVGFDVSEESREFLSCLGRYYSASDGKALRKALKAALQQVKKASKGSVALFAVGDRSKVLKHAEIDEEFSIPKGRYDIIVKHGEQTVEWKDVELTNDLERTAEF